MSVKENLAHLDIVFFFSLALVICRIIGNKIEIPLSSLCKILKILIWNNATFLVNPVRLFNMKRTTKNISLLMIIIKYNLKSYNI